MKVVVYSHDADVRAQMRLAIGRRPAPDVPEAEIIEVATEPALFRLLDAGGADVMVLDGEAQPAGGMGVCRQAKDEIYDCPPVLLIIGRPRRRLARHLVPGGRRDQPPDRPRRAGPRAGRPDARPGRRRRGLTVSCFVAADGGPRTLPQPTLVPQAHPRSAMDARTTWPALIGALIRGDSLTADETEWAMNEIMEGAATPAQIAGFGVALRIKGESVDEMTGLARADAGARHADQRARAS